MTAPETTSLAFLAEVKSAGRPARGRRKAPRRSWLARLFGGAR